MSMTFKEMDRLIDARLNLHTSPVIEFNRLPAILGVAQGSWWSFTRNMPKEERPPMFRAGGGDCLFAHDGTAAAWCKAFVRKHPKRFGIEVPKDGEKSK